MFQKFSFLRRKSRRKMMIGGDTVARSEFVPMTLNWPLERDFLNLKILVEVRM